MSLWCLEAQVAHAAHVGKDAVTNVYKTKQYVPASSALATVHCTNWANIENQILPTCTYI